MKRRFRKSIPLSRERQFYIMGISLSYHQQPEAVRRRIDALCREACPGHWEAFRRYVTREEPVTPAAMAGFVDGRTLERATRKYFLAFDIDTTTAGDGPTSGEHILSH